LQTSVALAVEGMTAKATAAAETARMDLRKGLLLRRLRVLRVIGSSRAS
jgi:hypothetical protein